MDDEIVYFVLVFDHTSERLIEVREFGVDADAAIEAYAQLEDAHRDNARVEVVLIGSDSIDTVRHTHSNYFEFNRATSPFLAGL